MRERGKGELLKEEGEREGALTERDRIEGGRVGREEEGERSREMGGREGTLRKGGGRGSCSLPVVQKVNEGSSLMRSARYLRVSHCFCVRAKRERCGGELPIVAVAFIFSRRVVAHALVLLLVLFYLMPVLSPSQPLIVEVLLSSFSTFHTLSISHFSFLRVSLSCLLYTSPSPRD